MLKGNFQLCYQNKSQSPSHIFFQRYSIWYAKNETDGPKSVNNDKKILFVTDKRHQTLLFIIDKDLLAGAARHIDRCIRIEGAFVMLRPEFPEPDIPTIHHLPRQRFMGNIALCLPVTLVAYSRPQVQIVFVEIYNRIELFNSFDALCFHAENFLRLSSW